MYKPYQRCSLYDTMFLYPSSRYLQYMVCTRGEKKGVSDHKTSVNVMTQKYILKNQRVKITINKHAFKYDVRKLK